MLSGYNRPVVASVIVARFYSTPRKREKKTGKYVSHCLLEVHASTISSNAKWGQGKTFEQFLAYMY
jgi:hypothetical protein